MGLVCHLPTWLLVDFYDFHVGKYTVRPMDGMGPWNFRHLKVVKRCTRASCWRVRSWRSLVLWLALAEQSWQRSCAPRGGGAVGSLGAGCWVHWLMTSPWEFTAFLFIRLELPYFWGFNLQYRYLVYLNSPVGFMPIYAPKKPTEKNGQIHGAADWYLYLRIYAIK